MPLELIVLSLIGLFSAAFSTVAGFGGGILLVAFGSMVLDIKTMIPLSAIYFLALSTVQLVLFRKHLDRRSVVLYCAAALPGLALGMWLFDMLDDALAKRFLGGLVLAWCGWMVLPWRPRRGPTDVETCVLSLTAGVADMVTASGGTIQAPLFLARGLRKEAFVASFAATSVLLNPIKAVLYSSTGYLTSSSILLIVVLSVSGLLGVLAGRAGLKRISPENFRRLALAFLALVAVKMLVF